VCPLVSTVHPPTDMPTMCGPGAMRYGGLENVAAGVGVCGNRACSMPVAGRRGEPCQQLSGARPPLPCGAPRRELAVLGDITNITGENMSLPGQPDAAQHRGGSELSATLSHSDPLSTWARPLQAITTEIEESFKKLSLRAESAKRMPEELPQSLVQVSFADSIDEYVGDISKHLFRSEEKSLPQPDYMDAQPEISSNMRTILIDWLVEVHMKHHLCLETLHLTVNIIDRYLSKAPVTRKRLQLVGVVAMFIAAKFEEINPPELDFWVYITASAYTQEDLVNMECTVLTTLNFRIMVPTAAHFLALLKNANRCDSAHSSLAEYIIELALLDSRMLCYPPSHVVSAALLLSNELLRHEPTWSPTMVLLSHRTGPALRGCAEVLRELFDLDRACLEGRPRAVYQKFSAVQRHRVATMSF